MPNKLLHRVRSRYKSGLASLLKMVILIELAFTILLPIFIQLTSSFMSYEDVLDNTVGFFSRHPTFSNYKTIILYTEYGKSLLNSVLLSAMAGALTALTAAFAGYGFAKFRFRGKTLVFFLVILSIVVPPQTIMMSLYSKFRYFDVFGLFQATAGVSGNLTDTFLPTALLSATGFGFRGGLFIFLMRQFYLGIPKELMEAAYVDGANVYRSYFSIVFPLGRSLMITVFLLSFSWTWTDTFYANIFMQGTNLVSQLVSRVTTMDADVAHIITNGVNLNAATMLTLLPLLVIFIVGQKFMVEGIERSGLVG